MAAISNQLTLRKMIARVHARVILFALVLVSVLLIVSGFVVIRGYAARNIALISASVGYAVEPAIVFHDNEAIQSGMIAAATFDDLNEITIRNPQGAVLARWNRPAASFSGQASRIAGKLLWPMPIAHIVQHEGATIAVVYVYGGVGDLGWYLLFGAFISSVSIGITFFATRVLAQRLQNNIMQPLTRLAGVIHEVRDQQAFGRRVPRLEILEIDELAEDLNVLLAELEGWHAGLTTENERLSYQALHDGLTGLGNRQMFAVALAAQIDESLRDGQAFAMLYLDANGFKRINDEHGHSAGDIILKEISAKLRLSVRASDTAFRLAGDEFAIILAPPVDRAIAAYVVNRINLAMQEPVVLSEEVTLPISLSTGIAMYPEDGRTSNDLIETADALMYRNKRSQ